jgi:hypothetical protein
MGESITVESYGGAAEVGFWPLVLLLIFLAWLFRANKKAAVWCALSALAILTLASIYIIVFGLTSLSALHDFNLAMAVLGGGLLTIAAGLLQEITIARWKKDRVLGLFSIGMGLFGLTMLVHGIVVPIQDLFLPRHIVEGDVTSLETRGRRPLSNIVHIGETQVQASTPLYRSLRLGQHVRAQVTSGSDFIRQLEHNPLPSPK